MNGRNSYSKTDTDATAMRSKDDQLIPGYNIQHSTSGQQFIVNWTIEQSASDTSTLPAHMDKMKQRQEGLNGPKLKNLCADGGYGSEENYDYLATNDITAYVKYPTFELERTGELQNRRFRRENFDYDPHQDSYTCPQGRTLSFLENRQDITINGYEKTIRVYQCESCVNCPFAAECKKNESGARTVSFSPQGENYKDAARINLNSEKGKQMRSERGIEVESAFGDIKFNMKHRRFILRGLEKVYIEYGLLAIAHNLRKLYCDKSGCWKEQYAHRAARKGKKRA